MYELHKMNVQDAKEQWYCACQLFLLFYKNANDSEMKRSVIELNGCIALIACGSDDASTGLNYKWNG